MNHFRRPMSGRKCVAFDTGISTVLPNGLSCNFVSRRRNVTSSSTIPSTMRSLSTNTTLVVLNGSGYLQPSGHGIWPLQHPVRSYCLANVSQASSLPVLNPR